MNEQPLPEQPKEQKQKDPLRDLVASLDENSPNRIRAVFMPPKTGIMFGIGPFIYRVSAINLGQLRFSAEFYGILEADGKGVLRPGGEIETGPPPAQKPHEAGRNPQNVTLDVHSGSLDGNAIFKPRAADGKNPVE